MAKARRTRTKHKRSRAARASSDDVVFANSYDAATRAIVTDIQQLERHAETKWRRCLRDIHKLATARKPANERQLAQVRHRLHDAQRELLDVRRLRRDVEGIIEIASAQLAALEVEVTAGMNTALVRYVVARATRSGTVDQTARTSRSGDFGTALAKAKHATAIVIADRNKMRDQLALLMADPERAAEADEWRRQLVVQEATVEHLKQGLRLLVAGAIGPVG